LVERKRKRKRRRIEETSSRADEMRYPEISAELLALLSE